MKSPWTQISLCSLLSINSITSKQFAQNEKVYGAVSPIGRHLAAASCFLPAHPELDARRCRVRERDCGFNWSVWISILHFLQHSAEFLFSVEIKIALIRLFLFCITFFHCCMIPSSCLELDDDELSPCFQSYILWGKRKWGSHTTGTASSFFIRSFWMFVSEAGFYSHPLVRTRGTSPRGWTGIWAPVKFGFHWNSFPCSILELILVADTWLSRLTKKFISDPCISGFFLKRYLFSF